MDILVTAAWFAATFIIILGPMILIHELGHFLTARRAGVRVEEFGLGFPPRLWILAGEPGTLRIGPVPIAVPGRLPLPIGLTIGEKVEAMVRREADDTWRLLRLRRLPPAQKTCGEGCPEDSAPEEPVLIPQEGSDEAILRGSLTEYDPGVRYSINALFFGGFVRMTGEDDAKDPRSLAAQPRRWRVATLLAGPLLNLLTAFLVMTAAYMAGNPEGFRIRITDVVTGSAAQEAGLQAGDIVLTAADTPITGATPTEAVDLLHTIIQSSAGRPLTLTLERDGAPLTLSAIPRREGDQVLLGIYMSVEHDPTRLVRYPLPRAMAQSGQYLVNTILMIAQLPEMLAQGEVSTNEVRPASIVGISQVLTLSLQQSVEERLPWYALEMAALTSLALGLTNLLPLPGLDGGRTAFVLLEAVRGRRLRPELEGQIHLIGMTILVALMLILIAIDIVNPIVPWSLFQR